MFWPAYCILLTLTIATILPGSASIYPLSFAAILLINDLGWIALAKSGFERTSRIVGLWSGHIAILACLLLVDSSFWSLKYLYPAGTTCNLLVILANGWKMPSKGMEYALPFAGMSNYCPINKNTKLVWLADIFPNSPGYFSAGDVILFLALAITASQGIYNWLSI